MFKVLVIDKSGSMLNEDCFLEGKQISRIEAIKREQIKSLK